MVIGQVARRENSTQQASILPASPPPVSFFFRPGTEGEGNPGMSAQRAQRTGDPGGVYGSREGGKGHVVGVGVCRSESGAPCVWIPPGAGRWNADLGWRMTRDKSSRGASGPDSPATDTRGQPQGSRSWSGFHNRVTRLRMKELASIAAHRSGLARSPDIWVSR